MIFLRKKNRNAPPFGKVEIFSRHCLCSTISCKKKRPEGFSHERCFHNLLNTLNREEANLTIFFDHPQQASSEHHFLSRHHLDPVISIQKGSEATAFLALVDHIADSSFHPDTLLYLVEDDYLHRPGWLAVLKEAFSIPSVDYATLYDHRDKYREEYAGLVSQIFVTKSCHWRTIPSTTQTFAVRFGTFIQDIQIHRRFSRNRSISDDHRKFLALGRKGRVLVSSIPGYSTHLDPELLSPFTDWPSLMK